MLRLAPVLLATLLVGATACGSHSRAYTEVRGGGLSIRAEVVRTPEERSRGLGGRDSLNADAGMLFVFPDERVATFWMKDMRFPLDFVWISADKRVVGVLENVQPPAAGTADSALPLYQPPAPILWALEVDAGTVARGGIVAGDAVSFSPEVAAAAQ